MAQYNLLDQILHIESTAQSTDCNTRKRAVKTLKQVF